MSPMQQDGRLSQVLVGETLAEHRVVVERRVAPLAHERTGRNYRRWGPAGRGRLRAVPVSAALVTPAHTDVFDGYSRNL